MWLNALYCICILTATFTLMFYALKLYQLMTDLSDMADIKKRRDALRLITEYIERRVVSIYIAKVSIETSNHRDGLSSHDTETANLLAVIRKEVKECFNKEYEALTRNGAHEEQIQTLIMTVICSTQAKITSRLEHEISK